MKRRDANAYIMMMLAVPLIAIILSFTINGTCSQHNVALLDTGLKYDKNVTMITMPYSDIKNDGQPLDYDSFREIVNSHLGKGDLYFVKSIEKSGIGIDKEHYYWLFRTNDTVYITNMVSDRTSLDDFHKVIIDITVQNGEVVIKADYCGYPRTIKNSGLKIIMSG